MSEGFILHQVEGSDIATTFTHARQDGSKINLIPDTSAMTATSPDHPSRSKSIDLIRLYKLQFLALFRSWRSPTEQKKIALCHSHLVAAGHASLHLVPLCGAITLLVLNWSQYFVGPFFAFSTTLQFVAKLHELLMQMSLAEIVLCIIRTQAVEGYVPLGALSATTQSMHISYIWSIDFLAAITSKSFSGPRRYLFIILTPALITLTALVGPSSAALMIPRPGSSSQPSLLPWGLREDVDNMFPSHLDSKQNMTLWVKRRLLNQYRSLTGQSDFESFEATYSSVNAALPPVMTQPYSIIQAYSNKIDVPKKFIVPRALQFIKAIDDDTGGVSASATIPTRLSTLVLDLVPALSTRNQTVSVKLPRPVVATKCEPSELKASSPIRYFTESGNSTETTFSVQDLIQGFLNRLNLTDALVNSLPPLWSASPEPGSSSYIGNFFMDDCASSPNSKPYYISDISDDRSRTAHTCLWTLTCTVAAYWETSEHERVDSNGLRLVRTAPLSKVGFEIPRDTRPITIDWDSISSLNTAKFANMISLFQSYSESSLKLAVSLATVISETSWQGEWISAYQSEETNQQTQYVIARVSYGYGYGASATSTRLSLVVIATYCTVTIAYVTYILASGHTSTAWSSATELVVLALQSRQTEHLDHTSVGIGSMQTYREPIGVRVGENKNLELVFAKDPNVKVRNLRRVVPNRAY